VGVEVGDLILSPVLDVDRPGMGCSEHQEGVQFGSEADWRYSGDLRVLDIRGHWEGRKLM